MKIEEFVPGNIRFLSGGGEMAALIRAKDWSTTPIGLPETWPQSLRTTLNIILHSKFPMFLWWGPELISFYNDAYRPSLGTAGKHPSILGKPAAEAWPEIWETIKPLIAQVISNGESTWSEDQLIPIYRNGKIEDVYWTFSYSPVNDESEKTVGVLVTCTETTEKVKILNDIKEREDQLNFTIQAAELGTWDLDPSTNRFLGNDRLKEWFGINQEDEIELTIAMGRIVEKDRQRVTAAIQEAIAPGSSGHYEIEYSIVNPKDNRERRVIAKGKAIFNGAGQPVRFSGTLQDITQQALARRRIEESEKRFRHVADNAPVLIWMSETDKHRIFFNKAWLNFTGRTREQEMGSGWGEGIHPEDLQKYLSSYNKAFDRHEECYMEYRLRRHDGKYRWVSDNSVPRFTADDIFEGYIGACMDIHERTIAQKELKENEEKLENQVRERTNELEIKNLELKRVNSELESFAYASSHDLKEPLRKIQTFASLLLENEKSQLTENVKSYVLRMQGAAVRMQTLINNLLDYSFMHSSERIFQLTDLNLILAEAKNDLTEVIEEKQAVIEADMKDQINIIPFQFRQLLQNLIGNAVKFSKQGSRPRISLKGGLMTNEQAEMNSLPPDNNYYHLAIADNGIGFDPQFKDRIFEIFQRLHPNNAYSGTGIGLAIVKKIVENHQGIIRANGEVNNGAIFDIFIPSLQFPVTG